MTRRTEIITPGNYEQTMDRFAQLALVNETEGAPIPPTLDFLLDQTIRWIMHPGWQGSNASNIRRALFGVVMKMRTSGSSAPGLSCRAHSELMNSGKNTAHAYLRRLESMQILERLPQASNSLLPTHQYAFTDHFADWIRAFTPKPEFEGRLLEQAKYMEKYMLHPGFAHGANVTDRKVNHQGLGPKGLDTLLHLRLCEQATVFEIVESIPVSRQIVSEKLKSLAEIGCIDLQKDGRTYIATLLPEWEAAIEYYAPFLSTYLSPISRKLSHTRDRINYYRGRGYHELGYETDQWTLNQIRVQKERERTLDLERSNLFQQSLWMHKIAENWK